MLSGNTGRQGKENLLVRPCAVIIACAFLVVCGYQQHPTRNVY